MRVLTSVVFYLVIYFFRQGVNCQKPTAHFLSSSVFFDFPFPEGTIIYFRIMCRIQYLVVELVRPADTRVACLQNTRRKTGEG